MYLDIQRALDVDGELRVKYIIHVQKIKIARRLAFPLLALAVFIYGIILATTFAFFSRDSFVRYIIITSVPILGAITISLIIMFATLKATLLLHDVKKPISFSSTMKQVFLLLLFIIFAVPVLLYSLIIRNRRYYFFRLAQFYIIDQDADPITAIRKTYYLIPDSELEHLFLMGDFGYANLYRQMYPIRQN